MIGNARGLKLYLVDSTGTLPSVSPLKTFQQHMQLNDENKLQENAAAIP